MVVSVAIGTVGCISPTDHPDPNVGTTDDDTVRTPRLSGLRVDSGRVVDERGRTVVLRGVCLSQAFKVPNPATGWFIGDWVDEAVFADIAARGFNLVRFAIFWEGIEPQRGVYDYSYLEELRRLVRLAHNHGLYIMINMHQDVFARPYATKGNADGAPEWALPHWPLPYVPLKPWQLNYMQPVVLYAFERFWRDVDGIQTHFRESWAEVARWFRDEPAVIGYNLFNEPWPGASHLLFADCFDRKALGPFYRRLIKRIREECPDRIIFFQPTAVRTNMLAPFGFPSALPTDLGENLVFAPHFYDAIVATTWRWDDPFGIGTLRLEMAADALVGEANRLGTALMIGEWNVWQNNAEIYARTVKNQEAYLDTVLRTFDERTPSWAFWDYNLGSVRGWNLFRPGSPYAWIAKALERPYPQRTAGAIKHLSFNPDNGHFLLNVGGLSGVTAPSEIYLPRHVYGDNFTIYVSDGATWTFDPGRRILQVDAPPAQGVQTIEVLPQR